MTPDWKRDRPPTAAPRSPPTCLYAQGISIEEAWTSCESVVTKINRERLADDPPDQPFTGRALTAAYLPSRPDLVRIMKTGKEEGRIGPSNSGPSTCCRRRTFNVADGFGKVAMARSSR